MKSIDNKLLVLRGLPASGKSTYAKELVAKGWKRVNKDSLRAMIDYSKWSKGNEKLIKQIESGIVEEFLFDGYNVVVDDTNFAYEDFWKEEAKFCLSEFEIKFFDTPLMECIERDSKRGDKAVGEKNILSMYNRYLKPKLAKHNQELPNCYIFDIDGTLAKMQNRNPHDLSKVGEDLINRDIVELQKKLYFNENIFLMSGREETCRKETEEWLNNNKIYHRGLYMRKENDTRNDKIVKKELYEEHFKNKYNVLAVFDDRNRVVDMWRSLGITCLQVDYGNF